MKAHLLYRDRDVDWSWVLQAGSERETVSTGRRHYQFKEKAFNPNAGLTWNADALSADLSLETLFAAMARQDSYIYYVARLVIFSAIRSDLDVIQYRQLILADCLEHRDLVMELYSLSVEAGTKQHGGYLGILARYPDSVLRDAIETIEGLLGFLGRLRKLADAHAQKFSSEGWRNFFAMLQKDLDDEFFNTVGQHLRELRFPHGELISAQLSTANRGDRYVLHRFPFRKWSLGGWWKDLFATKPLAFNFELHPRDEAGFRSLNELRNRGIAIAADGLGKSADHVRDFFGMLRVEMGFYVGCINLAEQLAEKGEPVCFPLVEAAEMTRLSFRGLYDVGLSLTIKPRVVGNDANADGKNLVVITGPNTGGKSTFLRSVGLAQLMMHGGMFVAAREFRGSVCGGLLTHYKREEDATMQSGKFDEELHRMSEIVDHLRPSSMILLNESFATTNEREGSEIGQQVISALLDYGSRALCVTHMYELAHSFYEHKADSTLFLRAERRADGGRTFRLEEGEPLPTSFGEDLYDRLMGEKGANAS